MDITTLIEKLNNEKPKSYTGKLKYCDFYDYDDESYSAIGSKSFEFSQDEDTETVFSRMYKIVSSVAIAEALNLSETFLRLETFKHDGGSYIRVHYCFQE